MSGFKTIVPLAFVAAASITLSAAAANTNIDQRGIRFSTASITIKVGDTVTYHNHDDVTHNIMVIGPDDDPEDEGLQKPGEIVTAKFDSAGTFEVRCAIHPKMKMTVTVEQ